MKKFLIGWTILTIILIILFFLGAKGALMKTRQADIDFTAERARIIGVKMPNITINNIGFEYDKEFNSFDHVIFPTIIFGIVFWSIPVALASLITLALRKK